MSEQKEDRWLASTEPLDPALQRALESAKLDEPSAARVAALEARVAAAIASTPHQVSKGTPADEASSPAALPSSLPWSKLLGIALVCVGAPALWLLTSSTPTTLSTNVELPFPEPASKAAPAPVVEPVPMDPVPSAAAEVERDEPARPGKRARRVERQVAAPVPSPALPEAPREESALAREVALLKRIRESVKVDPCMALRLAQQHRGTFVPALLADERDQVERVAARALDERKIDCVP